MMTLKQAAETIVDVFIDDGQELIYTSFETFETAQRVASALCKITGRAYYAHTITADQASRPSMIGQHVVRW